MQSQDWYHLVVRTVGLLATVNLDQPFDFANACPSCGAGAIPVPPLFIDAARMGKSLDLTAHDGRLIVRRELAESIRSLRLTGVQFLPVAHKTRTRIRADERYEWLEPAFEWPPLAASSVVVLEDQCVACRRSGHFDSTSPPTALHYLDLPESPADFGATHEYFGRWRAPGKRSANVGGGRFLIVSEGFRQALLTAKVRHVDFEPVHILRGDAA